MNKHLLRFLVALGITAGALAVSLAVGWAAELFSTKHPMGGIAILTGLLFVVVYAIVTMGDRR